MTSYFSYRVIRFTSDWVCFTANFAFFEYYLYADKARVIAKTNFAKVVLDNKNKC